ncbi:MAG: F0F1 ATP synthase subunit B [Bacteroidales bacterium]|nr:F0F1 ATP synthase subunit B [Candidatus Cryptobacteroides faecihippi]
MSLITPDFGLLVWMTLIFGIVFFVLAKWGFPMITGSVRERAERINASIKAAKEAEERLQNLAKEQSEMIEEARREQARILKETSASRDAMIENAKSQAQEEASKIISQARKQIDAEKESALSDIRKEVAMLSVSIAEKVLRKDLADDSEQARLISALVDEMASEKGSDTTKSV